MNETGSPTTDALIEAVMARHTIRGPQTEAAYYLDVHQQLAPLARDFETMLREASDCVTSGELRGRIQRALSERKSPLP